MENILVKWKFCTEENTSNSICISICQRTSHLGQQYALAMSYESMMKLTVSIFQTRL